MDVNKMDKEFIFNITLLVITQILLVLAIIYKVNLFVIASLILTSIVFIYQLINKNKKDR